MDYNANEEDQITNARSDFDLRAIVANFRAKWYWFFISVILFGMLAFLYLRYATPTYKISAKLLVNDNSGGSGASEASLLSDLGLFSTQSNVNNEVQILKSKTLLYKVIDNLRLNVTYIGQGDVKTKDIYLHSPFAISFLNNKTENLKEGEVLHLDATVTANGVKLSNPNVTLNANYGDTIHAAFGTFFVTKTGYPFKEDISYGVDIISPDYAFSLLYPNFLITVTNDDVTTIDLTYTTPVPEKGTDILNNLISVYIRSNIDENNRVADSTISFIDSRLNIVMNELNNIEQQISSFKSANSLTDIAEQSRQLVTVNTELQKQLSQQSVQVEVIESLEKYLMDEKNNKRIMPTTAPIQDPAFVALLDKYNNLQLQREQLLSNSTEANPSVKNIDAQLISIRGDLVRLMGSFKRALLAQQRELVRTNSQTSGMIRQVPAQEKTFLEYSRQQNIKQELYLYLLKKREETAVSRFNNVAPVRILDKARSDAFPFSPNKILIVSTALLMGLFFPASILFFRDYFNNRIADEDDVAKITKAPVAALISHNHSDKSLVVDEKSRSAISEQFRSLRSNLQFLLAGSKGKSILLTSSMSSEGKSFIAMNLGSVLGISGKKVLLLEFDLRKPKLSQYLGKENISGFSNYVVGDVSIENLIVPSGIHPNVYLVNSGPMPPNPSEILMHEKVGELMEYARKEFDYIIIDTPPIGLVSDAHTLAKYADVIFYVVRQNYTTKYQVKIVEDMRVNKKMKNINVVLNDVRRKAGYGYGSKYGYGYAYGYGYGNAYGDNGGYYEENGQYERKTGLKNLLKRNKKG